MTKAVADMGNDILVIVVADFDDLSVLNETAMNARGWVSPENAPASDEPREARGGGRTR